MNTTIGRTKRALIVAAFALTGAALVSPSGHAAEQKSELILFCAGYSPSCKVDQPTFKDRIPALLKANKLNVRVTIVDVEHTRPELLKKYNIEYVPAIFLSTRGNQVHEFLDERKADKIVKFTKEHVD